MTCPTQTEWGEFYLIAGDTISEAIIRGEGWDTHVLEALAPHLLRKHVLDVGANMGFLAVRFAQLGAAIVIAVEPNPVLIGLLQANSQNYPNIHPYFSPLYSRDVYLAPDQRPGWGPSSIPWLPSTYGHWAGRGDDKFGGNPIEVIKVDCQGADLHVLLGLEKTIERWRPVIAFEFEEELAPLHHHQWEDYQHFFNFMRYDLRELRVALPSHDYLGVPR